MGRIGRKLHRKFAARSGQLPTRVPQRRSGDHLPGGLPTIETLIAEGVNPVHAAYVFIQNLSSHFAERASGLPELAKYSKVVADAEDLYLPSGPPMSPLTVSYFTCWAFYDLRLNSDGETLGQCQLELSDILMMQPDHVDVLRKLSDSRMGIYEHLEAADGLVRLRELITGDEFPCLCTAGYQGTVGELSLCFRPFTITSGTRFF